MKIINNIIIFTDTVMYKLGIQREETAFKNLCPMTFNTCYRVIRNLENFLSFLCSIFDCQNHVYIIFRVICHVLNFIFTPTQ